MLLCFIEYPIWMNISQLKYRDLRNLLDQGQLTCVDIVKYYLAQIKAHNERLNAFLEIYADEAIEKAIEIDKKIQVSQAGELAGLVIGIKDLLCYEIITPMQEVKSLIHLNLHFQPPPFKGYWIKMPLL